ncbi:GIY-YIG nuclease family protein [Nocardiopsis protaetiae]|uniref:GIY-YIG nuclease family protein n=1 Tax=Nocardiopsis protaetiae TaxID=3382270 RepID=UPI00387A8EB1
MPKDIRVTTCTIQRSNGAFCDAPAHPDMPFPICGRHAMQLWKHIGTQLEAAANDPEKRTKVALGFLDDCEQQRQKERETRTPRVYYLQVGETVKIGTTFDLRQRLNSYPPNRKLLAVEPGGKAVEGRRLQQFAHLRAFGNEWFHAGGDLLQHINTLRSGAGKPPIAA